MAGRYKIFLGMAAGVGKTLRMLQEARAESDSGRDVVAALVETHGRTATAAALSDPPALEVLARRAVVYRGTTLEELDLPGVLARAPELCLIDELAHTNAPGVEHAKRHEDVRDVLEADIDVFSTVNVQHLESLNDHVFELTGVRVRETIPDEELARADEVVLIDITPQALVARLRRGEVYPADRVPAALDGFFRIENLQALREVALRQVAEDVEAKRLTRESLDVREERLTGVAPLPKAIAERLLALAQLKPGSERVVRRAWRSAQRLGAELDVLVVRAPDALEGGGAPAAEREELESLRRLCSVLGAHLLVEEGDDLADVAIRVARERGTTYVLLGTPSRRRGIGRLAEPLPLRIAHALPEVDVRLVAERGASG